MFDEETGAEEDFTENREDKGEAIGSLSKVEDVFDENITADHTELRKSLVTDRE